MRKLLQRIFSPLLSAGFSAKKCFAWLTLGGFVLLLSSSLLSLVRKSNDTKLTFPNFAIQPTKQTTPISSSASFTDDLGNQLGDAINQKIASAGDQQALETEFKNPAELSSFINNYLNQNLADYEQSLNQGFAESVQVHAYIINDATSGERKQYIGAMTSLMNPAKFPEQNTNSSIGDAETFYTNLSSALETIKVPSDYYFIHYDFEKMAKIKAAGYAILGNVDADPVKAAAIMKIFTQLDKQNLITYQALSHLTS